MSQSAAVCTGILLKLSARCNINCTYCYWFRDPDVYSKPRLLLQEVEDALICKLGAHIRSNAISEFRIILHGGEPLLYGKERFRSLCSRLRDLENTSACNIRISVMSNGILIDTEWAKLFCKYRINVGVSLDGPSSIHDNARIDFQKRGTFERVVRGIRVLQDAGINPGILSVCHPEADPEIFLQLVHDLKVKSFDVLVPDATHSDQPPSIADFYIKLFDLWEDVYSDKGISIRFFEGIIRGLLGARSGTQSIGYGPVDTVTVMPDGSLEALDVARIIAPGATRSLINLLINDFDAIEQDPLWREILNASTELNPVCNACVWRNCCGGGHIVSRWSDDARFDNPSVYCADLKKIIGHVWNRINTTLYLETADGDVSLFA